MLDSMLRERDAELAAVQCALEDKERKVLLPCCCEQSEILTSSHHVAGFELGTRAAKRESAFRCR